MDIEIAKHGRMSQSGSSLLKLIQNNDMPTIDLLVRESIQNSTDASLEGEGSVNISFNINEFNSRQLAAHLEGISKGLLNRFSSTSKLIEVRDSNTTGLVGPIEYSEVKDNNFGNLLKLIYEISMPQQEEGSGGSWGLGKTVYFRVGIGLVIYYTRIKDTDGIYKSRLSACLVENEHSNDSLIEYEDESKKRGIAWWGNKIAGSDETRPLTDERNIKEVLDVLRVKPYLDKETGTSIIIPFIDEEKLLEGIFPYEADNIYKPFWLKSLDSYISKSIQRWYAPRIYNLNFSPRRWLKAQVNGKDLVNSESLPVFKVIQELYNNSSYSRGLNISNAILSNVDIKIERIPLQKTFRSESYSGEIVFAKLNRKDLLMDPPNNNQSPFIQINEFNQDPDYNNPIIAFTRRPGMIVSYETVGPWVDGIGKTNSDEYIIGLFVPNSKNMLDMDSKEVSLEEYFRGSEKADHTSWNDWSIDGKKHTIVNRIQRNIKNKINKEYSDKESTKRVIHRTGLSRVLADMFLPPENFGKSALIPRNKDSKSNTSLKGPSNKPRLSTNEMPRYDGENIYIPFEINFSPKINNCNLELNIMSESGHLTANQWESEDGIGTDYPINLNTVYIEKIKLGNNRKKSIDSKKLMLDNNKFIAEYEDVKLKIFKTDKSNTFYGVNIQVKEGETACLFGEMVFNCNDRNIQVEINLSYEKIGEDNE